MDLIALSIAASPTIFAGLRIILSFGCPIGGNAVGYPRQERRIALEPFDPDVPVIKLHRFLKSVAVVVRHDNTDADLSPVTILHYRIAMS
jgi:hypothetical protein